MYSFFYKVNQFLCLKKQNDKKIIKKINYTLKNT